VTLRELRLWHWRKVMTHRANERRYEADAERWEAKWPGKKCSHSRRMARANKSKADWHLNAVIALNDHFPVGDTAEHDAARGLPNPDGCRARLAPGQHWGYCGETDMGQTLPALCTQCGGEFRRKDESWEVQVQALRVSGTREGDRVLIAAPEGSLGHRYNDQEGLIQGFEGGWVIVHLPGVSELRFRPDELKVL
jgi:hypothetical protein